MRDTPNLLKAKLLYLRVETLKVLHGCELIAPLWGPWEVGTKCVIYLIVLPLMS